MEDNRGSHPESRCRTRGVEHSGIKLYSIISATAYSMSFFNCGRRINFSHFRIFSVRRAVIWIGGKVLSCSAAKQLTRCMHGSACKDRLVSRTLPLLASRFVYSFFAPTLICLKIKDHPTLAKLCLLDSSIDSRRILSFPAPAPAFCLTFNVSQARKPSPDSGRGSRSSHADRLKSLPVQNSGCSETG
jgi:hypothetical protein